MAANTITALTELLERTEAAHGVYETTALDGVYDEAWAAWYAAFLIEHGIAATLGHAIEPARLAMFLADSFADLRALDPPSTEPWAAYTAKRIVAQL